MNITPTQPVPVYPAQEPPRTVRSPDQESSRPVLEPTRTEAMAQQVRRGDSREIRAESSADAHAKAQTPEAGQAKTAKDSLVGAVLDVFA